MFDIRFYKKQRFIKILSSFQSVSYCLCAGDSNTTINSQVVYFLHYTNICAQKHYINMLLLYIHFKHTSDPRSFKPFSSIRMTNLHSKLDLVLFNEHKQLSKSIQTRLQQSLQSNKTAVLKLALYITPVFNTSFNTKH